MGNRGLHIVFRQILASATGKKGIILVNAPPWDVESPPINLVYLNSYLIAQGIPTEICDLNIKLYNTCSEEEKKYWHIMNFSWSQKENFPMLLKMFRSILDKLLERIYRSRHSIVGLSINRSNLLFVDYIVKRIRENTDKKIILGGYSTRLDAELNQIDLSRVDYIVFNDGEDALSELIDCIYKGTDCRKIKGIGFMRKGKLFRTGERKQPASMLINYPTYEGFDFRDYSGKSVSMILSRGCIGKCSFCEEHVIFGDTYRSRKAEDIIQEIGFYVGQGIRELHFDDLAINGNPSELRKLCRLIIAKKYNISWGGNAIALESLDIDLLHLMKKAGCTFLRFGIETGSDRMLRKMGKLFTIKTAEKDLADCTVAGIRSHINLIVGLPGEEKVDFDMTMEFVKRSKQNIYAVDNIFTAYITPFSDFELHPEKYSITKPKTDHYYYWHDDKGNNFRLREERLKELVTLCHEQNIRITNISAFRHNSFSYKEIKDDFQIFLNNYSTARYAEKMNYI